MKLQPSLCLTTALLLLAVTGCKKSVVNPTGTWKVTTFNGTIQKVAEGTTMVTGTEGSNIQTLHEGSKIQTVQEESLKLKLDGGRLAGTVGRVRNVNGQSLVREQAIEEAKLQGSEITFTVIFPTSAGQGPAATTKYQGAISGDTIKGALEQEWMGTTIKKDWEAKRVRE